MRKTYSDSFKLAIYLFVLLILFVVTQIFYPIKVGHDLYFHLIRYEALIEALKDGQFPVYIDYNSINGYGYASKWFYSDFLLVPFAYVGKYIGVFKSYYLLINVFTILTVYISYISTYKIFKIKYIAYVFSIIYAFSYYRFYDLYNRAALGESLCLTFLPLALWGLYEVIWGDYKKWWILSISFTLMLFTHLLTPVMVSFIFFFITIFNIKRILNRRCLYLLLAVIFTTFCSAYQLFPLFEQFIDNHFYSQLTNERAVSFPVYRGEEIKYVIRGLFSGITYVVPEIAGVGIVITFMLLSRLFIWKNKLIKEADMLCIIGVICLFIVSPFYPWTIFPFKIINVIQFSWRFYALCTLFLGIGASIYYFDVLKTDKRRYLVGLPFLCIFTSLFIINSGQVFTNNMKTLNVFNKNSLSNYGMMGAEYLPSKIPNANTFFANRANDSVRAITGKTNILGFERKNRVINLEVITESNDSIELPLIYYKGYKASLNNIEIPVQQSEFGLIQIPIEQNGTVQIWFGGTALQKYSLYISIFSLSLLLIYVFIYRKNEN